MKISSPKGRAKKYPSIRYNYESSDHPGMFVAGTASHSLDFRMSAGGFIHGFRYSGGSWIYARATLVIQINVYYLEGYS